MSTPLNETTQLLSPTESTSRDGKVDYPNDQHYPYVPFAYSDWNHRRRLLMGIAASLILFVVLPFIGWATMLNNAHGKWPTNQSSHYNKKNNVTKSTSNNGTSSFIPPISNNNNNPDSNVPNFEHGSNTIQIHYQSFNPKVDDSQHSKHSSFDSQDVGYCQDSAFYNAFTLRLAYELPIQALNVNNFKYPFSASAITSSNIPISTTSSENIHTDVSTNTHSLWYAVADNSWSILQFQPMLYPPGSLMNRWIHHPILHDTATTVSNYHAIFQLQSTFYIVRKSVRHFWSARRRRLEVVDDNDEEEDGQEKDKDRQNDKDDKVGEDLSSRRDIKNQHEKKKNKQHSKHEEDKDKHDKKDKDKQEQDTSKDPIHSNDAAPSTRHKEEDDGEDIFSYHAIIQEITFNSTSDVYDIQDQCRCEMAFEGPTSGFKGAVGMLGTDGFTYVLALCDGNHCSEKKRDDAGNGKMVLMRKKKKTLYSSSTTVPIKPTSQPTPFSDMSGSAFTGASMNSTTSASSTSIPLSTHETSQQQNTTNQKERFDELLPQVQDLINMEKEHYGECIWETVRLLDVPKTAYFRDYSDMDITNDGTIIISTQQESAVWIGRLKGVGEGSLDPNELHFDKDTQGVILSFPKSDICSRKFCFIEGIHVLNDHMIMGVSGIMQGHGQNDFRCFDKQQSIHAFILP